MDWLWVLIGAGLIAIGLLDVFMTVLHYDGFGFLSNRLYRVTWNIVHWATGFSPKGFRAFILSLGAPLMIPLVIVMWVGMEILGFALLYYAGMNYENFTFGAGLEPGFKEALYLSGVSISTIGFGDVTPSSGIYEFLAVLEALIGLGILTLSISYVLSVYQVLQRLSILAAGLHHQAADTGDPRSILVPHFPGGLARDLDNHLMALHQGLVAYYEGMRRYPIVYYFYSRRPYRSMTYAFHMIGELAAALRWGLPGSHPATQEPWLPALITGFEDITALIEERFVPYDTQRPPKPASFTAFKAAFKGDKNIEGAGLDRFLGLNYWMGSLAHLKEPATVEEAYDRYKEWFPFAYRADRFFKDTAGDLGYNLKELSRDPGEPLF